MEDNPPPENNTTAHPDKTDSQAVGLTGMFDYQMPKYIKCLLGISGGLFIISMCLYGMSLLFGGMHHFDKDSAIDFVETSSKVLARQKHSVTATGFDDIRAQMVRALKRKNYYPINLERFVSSEGSDTVFTINFDAAEAKAVTTKISSLPDTGFQRLDKTTAFFEKKLDYQFTKYNLDQFITENDTWNDIEDISKYCAGFLLVLLVLVGGIIYYDEMRQHQHYDRAKRYQRAITASTNMTQSWVTAQTMLDSYHQRNLDQNNWTFRLSVIVMGIGFAIIFYGIHMAIELNIVAKGVKDANNGTSLIAIISTGSGVIVNLIGGTFLAIYNSTLKQAIDYTNSLQKTSTVGTSLAILKSIEDDKDPATPAKLVDAKIAIAKQLIGVTGS